jgi:hypothetical protein
MPRFLNFLKNKEKLKNRGRIVDESCGRAGNKSVTARHY